MADQSRLIELTVNLQAKQATGSLQEMADAAKELKDALLNAGKGAEGFGAATAALGRAKGELKELNQIARGITFDQQIQATVRFANGMVGAFAAVKGAMSLFGDKSSEEMAKVEKTMVSLLGVMKGIDEVARAFSAKNIASLKALGQGFTNMLKSAQTASLGMKAALISTGIGAIAVAVGLIIANFDKIVKVSRELLGIDKDISKEAEARIKYQDQIIKLDEEQLKIAKEIDKLTGFHTEELEAQRKLLDENLKKHLAELVLAKEQLEKDNVHKDNLKFMQTVWVGILQGIGLTNKALEVMQGYITKNGEKAKDSAQNVQNTEDQILVDKQQQLIAQEALTEAQVRDAQAVKLTSEYLIALLQTRKDNEKQIFDLRAKILQTSIDEKQAAIVLATKKAEEIRNDTALYANEQKRIQGMKDAKLVLDRQLEILKAQQTEFERLEAIDKFRKALQQEITVELLNQKNIAAGIGIEQLRNQLSLEKIETRIKGSTDQMTAFENLQKLLTTGLDDYQQEWLKTNDVLGNADERLKGVSTRLSPSGVRLFNDAFIEVEKTLNNIADKTREIEKVTESSITHNAFPGEVEINNMTTLGEQLSRFQGMTKEQLLTGEDQFDITNKTLAIKFTEEELNTRAGKMAIEKLAVENLIAYKVQQQLGDQLIYLYYKKEELANGVKIAKVDKQATNDKLKAKQDEIQKENEIFDNLIANGATDKQINEAHNALINKRLGLENDVLAIKKEQIEKQDAINKKQNESTVVTTQYENTQVEILKNNEKIFSDTKKTTVELQQQVKVVQQLADWWAKNAKFVEAGVEVLKAGLEIYAQTAANKVKMLQSDYQNWKNIADADVKKLDDQQKAIDNKLAKNQSDTDALLAEESDADSSRLAIIEQEIEAKQKVAEQEKLNSKNIAAQKLKIAQEDAKRQNAIADAQVEQQKREKLTAVVMAIVNTALAVVKAAPNPILMALAGVAGVAAVATIASQKIPPAIHVPIPKAAEGGPLVGPSHASGGIAIEAEGGEWIAPKWMMSNPRTAPVIDSLEAFRQSKPKFAEGGAVPSGIPASPATQAISIDYDKMAEAFGKVQINTSIKEIRDANRKFVNVIYDKSSI